MPAGHRLVIQQVSAIVIFPVDVSYVTVAVTSPEGFSTFLPPIFANSTRFDQPVQLYVDAGNSPKVVVGANSAVILGLRRSRDTCSTVRPPHVPRLRSNRRALLYSRSGVVD